MASDSPTSQIQPAGPVVRKVPAGDNRERLVCEACGFIHYKNPVVVVGAVCTWEDRILLCKRAIDPRKGYWTMPAGYLELGETTAQGAAREAMEEANAEIAIDGLLALYNIPRISQVQVIYAARLVSDAVSPGDETLETRLLRWREVPWDELAFPSVRWALNHHREFDANAPFAPRVNPPGEHGDF